MDKMTPPKIEYEGLTAGYEFAPASFHLDGERVMKYLNSVEDHNSIYGEQQIIPPMAMAALAMAAMSSGLALPPGAIHVSQNLEFIKAARIGERLTSYARVNRKLERGKFHLLTIGINVLNQHKATVLSGETGFILPLAAAEER
jgi:acyl dehydratase